MAAQIVADSGIFIALVMEEPISSRADQLITQWEHDGIAVIAPTLFNYEIVAAVRKNVYRGLIPPEEGVFRHDLIITLTRFIQFEINESLLRRAYELAQQLNRPTAYDAQYLALAEQHGCDFWTADERLFNAVHKTLNWVHWLGNLPE